MFLRETLLRGPALVTVTIRRLQFPVCRPGPGIAPQIPGDIGHERRSEHRERDSGEREKVPRKKKRELCHYGTAWSELERGKRRGRVTRDDNGHVSWELGIYLSRALGTRASTSILGWEAAVAGSLELGHSLFKLRLFRARSRGEIPTAW